MQNTATPAQSKGVIPKIGRWLRGERLTTLNLFVSFIIICIIFASQSEFFLTLENFANIGRTLGVVSIVSIGMTLVLITGGVDISVGSVAALSGVVASILWLNFGVPLFLATLLGLLACTVVGFLNGYMIAIVKINPLITTLASFSIVRGLAFVLSNGQTNQLNDEAFKFLGRGEIGGIPVSLILLIVLYIVFFVVMHFTHFGRNLYAIGVDTNQNDLEPGHVIASDLKDVGQAIVNVYKSIKEGSYKPGEVLEYGLASGGVDVTFEAQQQPLPQSIIDQVMAVRQQIIDGELTVERYTGQ